MSQPKTLSTHTYWLSSKLAELVTERMICVCVLNVQAVMNESVYTMAREKTNNWALACRIRICMHGTLNKHIYYTAYSGYPH